MTQNQVLCYKICYCLGVPVTVLREIFPVINNAADEIDYFGSKVDTRTYRAAARIYFMVIRHFDSYAAADNLSAVAGNRFASYLANTELNADLLFSECRNAEEFLGQLAQICNDKLYFVYKELEVGLSFCDFSLLLRLKIPNLQDIREMQYMLRRLPSTYNIYFNASEILNISTVDMLHSDTVLIKRLKVISGKKFIRPVADNSALASKLRSLDDAAFIKPKDIVNYNHIIIEKEIAERLSDIFTESLAESKTLDYCEDLDDALIYIENGDSKASTVVVCKLREFDSDFEKYTKMSIIFDLSVSKSMYKRIIDREWENVYLLSTKSSNN